MRSVLLGWFIALFSPLLWGAADLKEFAHDLSTRQRTLLNEFLYTLADTSAGYVLYGDKPLSIEICDLPKLRFLSSPDARTIALIKGKELWEDMRLSPQTKQYALVISEQEGSCHFICINRKAFLQTVKDNLGLFQYILGPTVTPENLLNELLSSNNQFYQVLQENQVLIEILLGHGRHNAIVHARAEAIMNPYSFGKTDEFPYVSKKLSRSWAASASKYQKKPSFGFNSVAEEEIALSKAIVATNQLKSFTPCEIPNFHCEPDSEETKTLLNTYEQNRSKVVKALAKKEFFEETLRKFFTSNSNVLEIPLVPRERELSLPDNKEETISKIVEVLHKKISMEPYGAQKFQRAFMEGVAAREKGKQMPVLPHLKRSKDIRTVERDLECCKNLERANAYFGRLGAREDLVALIPKEIYYKVLKPGKGPAASAKIKSASFQYTFQILGENNSKDWGVVKDENLGTLIPGIAQALVGMQQSEERVIYIHPKYAYGEETFFPPNASIVAQVRLLDFKEGEESAAVLPAHQLEKRDYRDLLAKFEVLRGEEFYDEGVEFWDSIKKSGDYIDFATFEKFFTNFSQSGKTAQLSSSDSEKFVFDLKLHLMNLLKAS